MSDDPAVTASEQPDIESGTREFRLRPALTTYGANLLVALLSLVNVLIVSRALGPTGRGDIAFLTTVAGLSAQIALFGVHRAIANFVPREPRLGRSLASNSLVLSLVLGGLAIGTVVMLVALVPAAGNHEPTARRWIALGAIPVVVFETCLGQLLRGYDDHDLANLAWVMGPVTNVVGNGTLALAGILTPTLAVGMWVGGQGLGVFVALVAIMRRHGGFGRGDLGLARRMLGFGTKTHPAQVMLLSNYRLDQWILGALKGSTQLGIYSVAVAWSEGLFFLPTALQAVQRPDLVRGTSHQAAWRAARVFRTCLFLTAVLAVVMWLAAPFLCVDVFGAAFRGSVKELRILTLGAFGIAALKLLGDALTSQRKPLLEMASIAVAFVLIVTLDLLLIPSGGGTGAAVASAIAYSAGGIAVGIIFVRALPARFRDLAPTRADFAWAVGRVRAGLR